MTTLCSCITAYKHHITHMGSVEVDEGTLDSSESMIEYVAPLGDILLGYATAPGYTAYRSPLEGSWYILALCKKLNEHAHE